MNKYLVFIIFFAVTFQSLAQTKPVKIVFDITSQDEAAHQSTVRHVKMMSASYPDSEFEVVVYGRALDMVKSDDSSVADEIRQLANNDKVKINVCELALKKWEVDEAQLLPGVGVVPDGILEIVTRQAEGWGYIKEVSNSK